MTKTEKAISWMEETAKDDRHGYCQTHRWGEDGDYDCSGAVITAWQQAGVPVKTNGATYTGNILSVFKKLGFKDITDSVNKTNGTGLKRGDTLLKPGSHVAMFCGNGNLVEASINEKGTITGGKPGDQTGKEFYIHKYYNYPWSNVLRYQEDGNTENEGQGNSNDVVFTYAAKTEDGEILEEVNNLSDYAGLVGKRIIGLAIKVNKGKIRYQAHELFGDWLPYVDGYNWQDHNNGYAGDKKPIDAVRVMYEGDNASEKAQYRVSPQNAGYYDWQYNDDVDKNQDGYAGEYGKAIDRFQLF